MKYVCLQVSALLLCSTVAANAQDASVNKNYSVGGVEGYLLEKELSADAPSVSKNMSGSKTGSSGESGSNITLRASKSTSKTIAKSARDLSSKCSTKWIDTAGTTSRYWDMYAGHRGRVRLTVATKTFYGSPSNPDTCARKWYYNARIAHGGRVTNIIGKSMIEFRDQKSNEAYLVTSRYERVKGKRAFPAKQHDTLHAAYAANGAVLSTSTRAKY